MEKLKRRRRHYWITSKKIKVKGGNPSVNLEMEREVDEVVDVLTMQMQSTWSDNNKKCMKKYKIGIHVMTTSILKETILSRALPKTTT